MSSASGVARRTFRDARVRTIAFGYLFAAYSYIQPVGYRHTYPTVADRIGFAHSFGSNDAIRLFYGEPYNILSGGGYSAGDLVIELTGAHTLTGANFHLHP